MSKEIRCQSIFTRVKYFLPQIDVIITFVVVSKFKQKTHSKKQKNMLHHATLLAVKPYSYSLGFIFQRACSEYEAITFSAELRNQ
jgi:hypothetical protein